VQKIFNCYQIQFIAHNSTVTLHLLNSRISCLTSGVPEQLRSPVHPVVIGCIDCGTSDISPPHSAEFHSVWIYISTPPYVLTAKYLAKQKEDISISSYPCLHPCSKLSLYFLSTAGTVGTSLDEVLGTITKAWESPRCLASDR